MALHVVNATEGKLLVQDIANRAQGFVIQTNDSGLVAYANTQKTGIAYSAIGMILNVTKMHLVQAACIWFSKQIKQEFRL